MSRWFWGGLIGAVVYLLIAASMYQRQRKSFDQQVEIATYRLSDAEEVRQEIASKIQLTSQKANDYESDPSYLAAQAKVDAASTRFPSDAVLVGFRLSEIRYGLYGAGAYMVIVLCAALSKLIRHKP